MTTKIRAVVADDEPLARRGIRQMLQHHPDVQVVAEARTGRETVRILRALKPDLVFLDVQMPVFNGFEVVREIGAGNMPAVIFVTAYDKFALQAFDAYALDYVLKPLQEARFAQALDRVREQLRSAHALDLSRKLSAILAEREQTRSKQRVLIRTATGEVILEADEIDWIEADSYYAAVHSHGNRHLLRESLSSLSRRLDQKQFVRVHRSAIVNISFVREVNNSASGTVLVLHNGNRVAVSRRRRARVIALLRSSDL